MRTSVLLPLALLALAACDRVTSPSVRDAGTDSVASLWEEVDAGFGAVNYNAVTGSSPDDVVIVGDQGVILHWDGLSLLPEASGTVANLRGVAVVDPTLAYAVGDHGTVLKRQNGVWLPAPPLTTAVLNAVVASASGAVAVGEQGVILNLRQGIWELVPNDRTENYYALTDANDGLIIVGSLGVVVQIDVGNSTVKSAQSIPGYTKVLAGATHHSSEAILVGVDGGFFRYQGGSATRIDGLPQKFLRAVSVLNGTAWVVGHEGLVAEMSASGTPTLVPIPDDRWLLGVYAAAADDLWVVGRSGLILRGPPGVRGNPDAGVTP
jgi:hypothetical protein